MAFDIEPVVPRRSNLPGVEPFVEIDVDRALLALSVNGGNVQAARRDLVATCGSSAPSEDTIKVWREKYPNRYLYHATENSRTIEDRIAITQRELVTGAADAAKVAVALEHERLLAGEVKDAASSARNLQTVAGIGVTKILEITGRPTQIVEHRKPEDIVRRLNDLVIDSDAEEESAPIEP